MNTPTHKETFEKIVKRLTEFVVLGKAHLEIGRGIGEAITADAVISNVAPVFLGHEHHSAPRRSPEACL